MPGASGMRSELRRILLVGALPVAVYTTAVALSGSWYSVDLSGIPDEGQVPPQMLAWFLFAYRSGGSVWSDSTRGLTWLMACLSLLAPAALAWWLADTRVTRMIAAAVTIGIACWACFSIPPPPAPSEFVTYFTAATVARARWWALALSAVGVLAGTLLARRRGQRSRSGPAVAHVRR